MSMIRSSRQVAVGVLVLLLLSVAVRLFQPLAVPVPKLGSNPDQAWGLSENVQPDSQVSIEVIVNRRLWGSPLANLAGANGLQNVTGLAAEDPPLTAPDWRFAGSFLDAGQHTVLLIQPPDPIPKPLHVGDKLPGGAVLKSISADFVTIQVGKREARLSTHRE